MKTIWLVLCHDHTIHLPPFQAGNPPIGAYFTKAEALQAARAADQFFNGHRVVAAKYQAFRCTKAHCKRPTLAKK